MATSTKKKVGFWRFTFHAIMSIVTGGVWLLGILLYLMIKAARK